MLVQTVKISHLVNAAGQAGEAELIPPEWRALSRPQMPPGFSSTSSCPWQMKPSATDHTLSLWTDTSVPDLPLPQSCSLTWCIPSLRWASVSPPVQRRCRKAPISKIRAHTAFHAAQV
jgi:hypothetical protein